MEKFKAVEKAMKTKAYSKEGLSAAAKLDPKEQAKVEASEFLSSMVDELEQQIEALEAEGEAIQATMKKGKNQSSKVDRMAEIERIIEQHKWHQGKLELIRRSLENGGVETEQVNDLEETIRYYVSDGMNEDYMEDEEMYNDLALEDDEGVFGMGADNEKSSSQDTQSVQDDLPEPEPPVAKPVPRKAPKEPEAAVPPAVAAIAAVGGRKASAQTKSPLPALATLHMPLSAISNGSASGPVMKPASVPTRPAGEGLKYASAAAAAAASDKNNVGIAPLPPPPGAAPVGISPLPSVQSRTSATSSPALASVQPVQPVAPQQAEPKQPTPGPPSEPEPSSTRPSKKAKATGKQPVMPEASETPGGKMVPLNVLPPCAILTCLLLASQTNGATNGIKPIVEEPEEECVYHLPASLQDLVDTYETSKKRPPPPSAQSTLRMMTASQASCPESHDAEVPRTYRPDVPMPQTGSGFPREPLPIFDDPRLYTRIDPDTLFYVFYYKQNTAQQYLAAKALKDQSWRFHKQYQTWFQRHEEPKNITEEFEQGTYRFFDYESTWFVPSLP